LETISIFDTLNVKAGKCENPTWATGPAMGSLVAQAPSASAATIERKTRLKFIMVKRMRFARALFKAGPKKNLKIA
jgi:hypothetical protein